MTAERKPPMAAGIRDLGVLDGPVLCFGGPYSNLQATRAVLAAARGLGIDAGNVICTGDVVAYGGNPAETVDLVRRSGIRVVMGNCEESLGFNAADCGCGFEDGSDCAAWSEDWFAFAANRLDDDAKAWMRTLSRRLRFRLAGRRFVAIHGGDENISEYVFRTSPDGPKAETMDRLSADAVIAGHAGLPFTQMVDGRLWHNAGVVGLPANDGTPRGWFSTLTPGSQGIEIRLHALDYDHAAAARALEAAIPGLPYAATLRNGLWPNMAVLPKAERLMRGRALDPAPVTWPAVAAAAE